MTRAAARRLVRQRPQRVDEQLDASLSSAPYCCTADEAECRAASTSARASAAARRRPEEARPAASMSPPAYVASASASARPAAPGAHLRAQFERLQRIGVAAGGLGVPERGLRLARGLDGPRPGGLRVAAAARRRERVVRHLGCLRVPAGVAAVAQRGGHGFVQGARRRGARSS